MRQLVIGAGESARPFLSAQCDIVRWRLRLLADAGLPAEQARQLAADRRLDVHAVLELVDRGCPPALAVRIVAPLEGGPACDGG